MTRDNFNLLRNLIEDENDPSTLRGLKALIDNDVIKIDEDCDELTEAEEDYKDEMMYKFAHAGDEQRMAIMFELMVDINLKLSR